MVLSIHFLSVIINFFKKFFVTFLNWQCLILPIIKNITHNSLSAGRTNCDKPREGGNAVLEELNKAKTCKTPL